MRASYDQQPWLLGCNFTPSTAVNQLEMWQADTFDPEMIDRELGWAAGIGMNTVRVYLHDLLWEQDSEGFLKRIDQYQRLTEMRGSSGWAVPWLGLVVGDERLRPAENGGRRNRR